MPDEETSETESPSILERTKAAIGLGAGEDGPETEPDPAEDEPKPVLTGVAAARKRYKDRASQNHLDKEARKDAADKIE